MQNQKQYLKQNKMQMKKIRSSANTLFLIVSHLKNNTTFRLSSLKTFKLS